MNKKNGFLFYTFLLFSFICLNSLSVYAKDDAEIIEKEKQILKENTPLTSKITDDNSVQKSTEQESGKEEILPQEVRSWANIYLDSLDLEEYTDKTIIRLTTSKPFKFVDFLLFKPDRLVLDIIGDNFYSVLENKTVNAELLKNITIGYFIEDIRNLKKYKRVDLIVFTFSDSFEYSFSEEGKTFIIEIKAKQKAEEGAEGLLGAMGEGLGAASPDGQAGAEQGETEASKETKDIKGKQLLQDTIEQKKKADKEKMEKEKQEEKLAGVTTEKPVLEGDEAEKTESDTEKQEGTTDVDEKEEIKDGEQEKTDIEETKDGEEKKEQPKQEPPPPKTAIEIVMEKVQAQKKAMILEEKEGEFKATAKKEKINFKKQIKFSAKDLKYYKPTPIPGVKKYTLEECIDTALKNHLPAQIALEKIKLAKLKLWETKRNLFPNINFNLVKLKGEAGDQLPFTEEEYKVDVEQNLYDGGAKKYLLRQAKVNMEVAKKTYDQVKSELVYNVEEAYFNYLMAKMNLNTQRNLLYETTEVIKQEEEKLKQGLTRLVDFRSMKASYNQIQYQIATSIKDLSVGELSLRQVMSIKSDVPLEIIDSIGYKEVNMNLQDCLWLAYKYRPEYLVNRLMVEYNEYDVKSKEAASSFQVNFTGQYGKMGSSYESEILSLTEAWYAGVKVSKPFGGSTVDGEIVKEHSAPKIGQDRSGNSYSRSLKVSILDNLAMFTEKKEADISFQEAINELEDTEKQVETDILNAYYDYQKSVIQLDSAFDKIMYREEELEVKQMLYKMEESSSSEVLDTKMKLADEKSFYYQGLVNYYLSIANMNKAIGLVSYYK
jgi:outer membrane protein TolC